MKVVPFMPDDIAEKVALQYGISMDVLRSRNRSRQIAAARSVAMYLTREFTHSSFSEIGEFYFRDHSIAINLYEKARKRMENDDEFRNIVNAIKENLIKDGPRKRERSGSKQKSSFMTSKAAHTPSMTYSFDNFIVGASDELAHKVTKMISENEAPHSPLFIYGDCGLGKTHLLHAIENHVAQHRSTLYITGEEFTNEWIRAVREGRDIQFKSKYRDVVECLLLDNVQFFANKDQVQNVFLHIIQSLNEKDARIAVSADVPPQDIPGLNSQLQKYFAEGTIVELQPPDDALKRKVLMQHIQGCHGDTIPISDDVMDLVAKYSLNFHTLLKCANTLNSYANLTGKHITMQDIDTIRTIL